MKYKKGQIKRGFMFKGKKLRIRSLEENNATIYILDILNKKGLPIIQFGSIYITKRLVDLLSSLGAYQTRDEYIYINNRPSMKLEYITKLQKHKSYDRCLFHIYGIELVIPDAYLEIFREEFFEYE
jgi:hypothetical protein